MEMIKEKLLHSEPKSVQRGSIEAPKGGKSVIAVINPVNPIRSVLDFSPTGNIRGRLLNETTIEFEIDEIDEHAKKPLKIWFRVVER
ncbi:MAG: hypothetical protein HY726_18125 [Candidatus Rokubacteria bacterium]|nr:hypothetical protein [Candidatus Rokubacteria bacterium]